MSFFEKVSVQSRSDDIDALIFLRIKSKAASSGPPIGPILGQYGIPAGPFCEEFNERTTIFKSRVELFVTINLYRSGLYDFIIDLPSVCFFLKRALTSSFCVGEPGSVSVVKKDIPYSVFKNWRCSWRSYKDRFTRRSRVITAYMLYEILSYKSRFDFLRLPDFSEFKRGLGTVKSMGIHIATLHRISRRILRRKKRRILKKKIT